MDRSKRSDAELLAEWDKYAEDTTRPDTRAIEIYLKCNSMRNIWNEMRRRGLPDPPFPEHNPLEELLARRKGLL